MENFDLYQDIATRTKGDIYIGVVGPVRTGKSTFITNFMQQLVLPNIVDEHHKARIIDELPQSADGKTIMTTQPKFVPDGGVKVCMGEGLETNVRLIDCVGYPFDEAQGFMEGQKSRLVKTPWSNEDMPFVEAAELGTRKVITDHCTIGVMVTTDGSITDISREGYAKVEKKIVDELKALGKPFVILLNSKHPHDSSTLRLQASMQEEYAIPVLVENVATMDGAQLGNVLREVLLEFPLKSIEVVMPAWLQSLPRESKIISHVIANVAEMSQGMSKMSHYSLLEEIFQDDEYINPQSTYDVDFGKGTITAQISPKPHLFYQVLSEQSGQDIKDDYALVSYIKELAFAKDRYDKIKTALEDVDATGYGVVVPSMDDMNLQPPEIIRKGGHYGVKLHATAPSLHIMKVDVKTEVNPVMSSEVQDEQMLRTWLSEYGEDYKGLWHTNMFGKTLDQLAKDGLNNKITSMPDEARNKLRKTVTKIVNEGKGGVLCILL